MSADIKEVYDTLYYGGELEFKYNNNCYNSIISIFW